MSIKKQNAAMALTVWVAFVLLAAPAHSQSVGGIGQPTRKPDGDAPQAPREPPRAPEPPPAPPPAPPAATPPPLEAQPVPAAPQPGPSDNAPIVQDTRPAPSDNAPVRPETPRPSVRVTTPIGQRLEPSPVPRPDDGDDLYPPPPVLIVPPIIVVSPPTEPTGPPPDPVLLPPAPAIPNQSVPLPSVPAKIVWPEGTLQAAFTDIERAWTRPDLAPLRRHLRAGDAKIGVSVRGKFAYSLSTRDFLSLTGTALRRFHTVAFRFTNLRRAVNGDVTAYGRHIYRVPPAPASKTVYISYTLRRLGTHWYVVGVGSSPKPLVRPLHP